MYAFIFIMGTIFGSFLKLVVDRSLREESIVFPRSHCEFCGHELRPLDLIPIFSYLGLRGRCKYCGEKLSIFYPVIEIFGGFLLLLSFILSENLLEFILLGLGLYLGLLIGAIDYRSMEFFSSHIYISLGLGLLYRYIFIGFDWAYSKFFLIFSLSYLLLYKIFEGNLGDGDYYYYIALSLYLKSQYLIYFILFSIWIGAIFAIIKAIKHRTTKLKMPFCPPIFLSFILSLILGYLGVI